MNKETTDLKAFTLSRPISRAAPDPTRAAYSPRRREYTICSVAELRSWYAPPKDAVLRKERPFLDEHACRMLSLSPYIVFSTSHRLTNSHDCSPRGGAPGFIKIEPGPEPRTIMIADMPGNNRLDTLENIASHGGSNIEPEGAPVGLLVLVPGLNETLRINGLAILSNDPDDLEVVSEPDQLAPGETPPRLAIKIRVMTSYLHCGASARRARLWDANAQQDPANHPSLQEMLRLPRK